MSADWLQTDWFDWTDWFNWTASALAFSLLIGSFLLIVILVTSKRKPF
jgi:hypothetical protein